MIKVTSEIFLIRWIFTQIKQYSDSIEGKISVSSDSHNESLFCDAAIGCIFIIIRYVVVDATAAIPSAIGSA